MGKEKQPKVYRGAAPPQQAHMNVGVAPPMQNPGFQPTFDGAQALGQVRQIRIRRTQKIMQFLVGVQEQNNYEIVNKDTMSIFMYCCENSNVLVNQFVDNTWKGYVMQLFVALPNGGRIPYLRFDKPPSGCQYPLVDVHDDQQNGAICGYLHNPHPFCCDCSCRHDVDIMNHRKEIVLQLTGSACFCNCSCQDQEFQILDYKSGKQLGTVYRVFQCCTVQDEQTWDVHFQNVNSIQLKGLVLLACIYLDTYAYISTLQFCCLFG